VSGRIRAAVGQRLDGVAGFDRRTWAVAIVVVVGAIMSILSTTSVNVALESLGQEFGASIDEVQWVVTAYLLALAAVIPMTGWAAERFGVRRLWMITGSTFVAASLLCGQAWSLESLIVCRVLQGLAGGMIMPMGMIILARTVGPDRVGRAMSVIGVPMLLGPVFGPVLGGLFVEHVGWPWVFYMNVPVGLLGLALAWRLLPPVRTRAAHRLDWLGLLLASPGVASLTFGLSEIPSHGGLAAPIVYGPLAVGGVLVAAFVVHARRLDDPLIDVRLFAGVRLAAATATTFLLGVALFGSLLVLPLYFQILRGEGALTTGLLLVPQGVASAAAMPFVGPLTDRFGGGRVVVLGVCILATGTFFLTQLDADTPYPFVMAALAFRGFGLGGSMMPAIAAAYAAMRPESVPRATSGLNVTQRVGGSIGAALLAVILNVEISAAMPAGASAAEVVGARGDLGQYAGPVAGAFETTFWWAFWLSLAALPAAFVLARRERIDRRADASALDAVSQHSA
jgi:EmrB/QacA subfamily drug resistance transporter